MSSADGAFESKFLSAEGPSPPYVDGSFYVHDGKLIPWSGETAQVFSPIIRQGHHDKICIGKCPMMGEKEAIAAIESAKKAYNGGLGVWPRLGPSGRIDVLNKFVDGLKHRRDEIVNLLMWEICKPLADSRKEVDRTIAYIQDTIAELKKIENEGSTFTENSGIIAHTRRVGLGTVLVLGPFNYPFNETYTLLIPALLMGNTVVLKQPRTGCLCHTPSLQLFADLFPPGVVNTIAGAGRSTMPAIMKSGLVDVFAFIGTNQAAASMIKEHPSPNRLRVCLGLDAKNAAIILPSADMSVAVSECVLGSLSFNGQRCTAIKVIYVHESRAEEFVKKFSDAVDKLVLGLPWQPDVFLTPLPEPEKPAQLKAWIDEALSKGAKVVNRNGNTFDRSFVAPTVLYPVAPSMSLYTVEQFGPIVPIVPFSSFEGEVLRDLTASEFGQQAAVFASDSQELAPILDALIHQVSRVNINAQCQRGPDNLPFTGRKNSAAGTLSVHDALRVFSIRSLVATKAVVSNQNLVKSIVASGKSQFVRMDHIF